MKKSIITLLIISQFCLSTHAFAGWKTRTIIINAVSILSLAGLLTYTFMNMPEDPSLGDRAKRAESDQSCQESLDSCNSALSNALSTASRLGRKITSTCSNVFAARNETVSLLEDAPDCARRVESIFINEQTWKNVTEECLNPNSGAAQLGGVRMSLLFAAAALVVHYSDQICEKGSDLCKAIGEANLTEWMESVKGSYPNIEELAKSENLANVEPKVAVKGFWLRDFFFPGEKDAAEQGLIQY